mmetsp:Transcript_15440/g.41788  ORF Transcript_15440/g.41788 Transcript_15440/m.41788 type:complete len:238 (-) Transcript_15440:1325-2038(-)
MPSFRARPAGGCSRHQHSTRSTAPSQRRQQGLCRPRRKLPPPRLRAASPGLLVAQRRLPELQQLGRRAHQRPPRTCLARSLHHPRAPAGTPWSSLRCAARQRALSARPSWPPQHPHTTPAATAASAPAAALTSLPTEQPTTRPSHSQPPPPTPHPLRPRLALTCCRHTHHAPARSMPWPAGVELGRLAVCDNNPRLHIRCRRAHLRCCPTATLTAPRLCLTHRCTARRGAWSASPQG